MKDKVVQAIEKRGKNMVSDAADKLRTDIKKFCTGCGDSFANGKQIAQALRALADQYDGTSKAWVIPEYFWEKAKERALNDFMNQFDSLTRFVNKDIECVDAQCEEPTKEVQHGTT